MEKIFYNDSEWIVKYIEKNRDISVIPSQKNKKEYNKDIYKNRNQIDCFFKRLKQFRRIVTIYVFIFIIRTTHYSFNYNTKILLNCLALSQYYSNHTI